MTTARLHYQATRSAHPPKPGPSAVAAAGGTGGETGALTREDGSALHPPYNSSLSRPLQDGPCARPSAHRGQLQVEGIPPPRGGGALSYQKATHCQTAAQSRSSECQNIGQLI